MPHQTMPRCRLCGEKLQLWEADGVVYLVCQNRKHWKRPKAIQLAEDRAAAKVAMDKALDDIARQVTDLLVRAGFGLRRKGHRAPAA